MSENGGADMLIVLCFRSRRRGGEAPAGDIV